MLVYGDSAHSVYVWNAVDVLIEGQLQHGEVINVAEKGLIVDFQCPGQRAQLVEYGRIFQCKEPAERATPDVQALLRRQPDGAWIWYPGRVVPIESFLYEEAQYVEVQLPNGTVRELLPVAQVRPPPAGGVVGQGCVGQSEFVVRSCLLPASFGSDQSPLVWEGFKSELGRACKVLYISRINDTFSYLQRQDAEPLTAKQAENTYQLSKRKGTPGLPLDAKPRPDTKPAISAGEEEGVPLPAELLTEIFRALDSIGRVRCRRVCALWNDILTTDANFPEVRVSAHDGSYGAAHLGNRGMYWVVACLLKCLNSATTTLIVTGLGYEEFPQLAAPIRHIRQARRLPLLVLGDCLLGDPSKPAKDVIPATLQLGGDCFAERMVWVRCTLLDSAVFATVAQYTFRGPSTAAMEVELWDVLESCLVVPTSLKRPPSAAMVSRWIADCIAFQDIGHIHEILKALREYQGADPRPSNRFRDWKWTPASLVDLNPTQLTKIALTRLTLLKQFLDENDKASNPFLQLLAFV
ncbi:uncharacterized protein LOC129592445 [Paramacrobiotus metropolitanus]|uniref:uncharacterized protein LOC129592445 n=1 Tax=Paramacrobiotus metropolitanus TaxID=2943436 RepID=UPI002445788C|nr:uncharacterized protein LOC129592445 [Paramacrobiotus metropolitanus]